MTNWAEKFAEYEPFLDDVRRRFRNLGIFFLTTFVVGFASAAPLVTLARKYLTIAHTQIVTVSPFQFMNVSMDIGLTIALVATLPLVVYQAYDFLKEALTARERRVFWLHVPVVIMLFILGFVYSFLVLYTTFGAIAGINVAIGLVNYWDISKFLSEIFVTSALLGLLFEFPVLLSVLVRLNLLGVSYLRARRREAIIIILIFTSLLPPTDAVSLVLMSAPLVGLYECVIWVNRKHRPLEIEVVPAS